MVTHPDYVTLHYIMFALLTNASRSRRRQQSACFLLLCGAVGSCPGTVVAALAA